MNSPLGSDSELVAACLKGDREAFRQVMDRHLTAVRNVAYRQTGDAAASEDVAQETFLQAWLKMKSLASAERLKPWLCGIARNLARNLTRRQSGDPLNAPLPLQDIIDRPAAEPTARDIVAWRQHQKNLWNALGCIPARYRDPLTLFYRDENSIGAVARILHLSEDTTKQRLCRGRQMLKQHLENTGNAAEARSRTSLVWLGLAGLPALLAQPATAATATAKGKASAVALQSGLVSLAVAIFITPVLGIWSAFHGLKRWTSGCTSPQEAIFVKRAAWVMGGYMILFHILSSVSYFLWLGSHSAHRFSFNMVYLLVAAFGVYLFILTLLVRWTNVRRQAFQVATPATGSIPDFWSSQMGTRSTAS